MAVSSPPILNAGQRAWRYWFADGLTNLVLGVNMLLMAFCLLFPPRWPPTLLAVAAWAVALVSYVVIAVRHREIVEWLNTKTTYPRTGYVQTPVDDPLITSTLTMVSLRDDPQASEEATRVRASQTRSAYLMLGLVLLAMFALIGVHYRWVWTAAGILVGVAMAVTRTQYRVSWIVPIGFPLVGLYMTLYVTSWLKAPAYFIVGWGIIFVLDGGTALIRYVLQNPAPRVPVA
jgi:hypothetical protein